MRNPRKVWKLEVTCAELTILQIAVERFANSYDGNVFTKEEIQGAIDELNRYNYIDQFTSQEDIKNQAI